MKIVFMGTPDFAVPSLKKMIEKFNVSAIVTQPDKPSGRGKKLTISPIKEVGLSNEIPIFQPEKIRTDSVIIDKLKELKPDFIIVVAYGQILTKEILDIPRLGCICLHASLLPMYRGSAPINWCLINGETKTGNTTILMDTGIDTGDMLMRSEIEISESMTAGELYNLLKINGAELLEETINGIITGKICGIKQQSDGSSYVKMLNKQIAKIDWNDSSINIHNLIRGLSLEDEKIIALESIENFLPNKCFKFITANGLIKKTTLDKFVTAYSKLMAIKLKNDDLLASVSLIDSQDEERFVEIETTNGLNFVVSEPELEFTDRNILGVQLVPLKSGNQIKSIRFVDNYEYKEFIIGINKKGNIKTFSNMNSNSYEKVKVNSFRNIIAFSNKGKVFKFPAYLLQNTEESNISDLVDGFEKDELIIKVAPINEFGKIGEDLFVYFFSREGLVKKTSLREFLGEFNNQIAYKFKTPKDELINVDINFENATVILVTKNGMGIKFSATAINPMGRVASGVTGISLKDDNKVIFGKVIPPSEGIDDKTLEAYNDYKKELTSNYEKLILESKQKEKAEVNIEDIKLQNRAGRGSSLMILVLEDYIRDVIIK